MGVFVFGNKVKSEDISTFDFTSFPTLETGPDGRTALHIAALQGDLISLAELLRRGADINATDTRGMTALHLAAAAGDDKVHICELLLDAGAAIDAADHCGDTALHHAARAGGAAMVKMLLERGPRVVVNGAGRTARGVAMGDGVSELFAEEEEDGRWWERVLAGFGGGRAECEGSSGYGPCGVFEEGGGCKFCSEFYIAEYEEAVEMEMEVEVRIEDAGAGGRKRKREGGK